MKSLAFGRLATVTYSTKRNNTLGGVYDDPETHIVAVVGTPRMPMDVDTVERYHLQSPRQPFVVYFEGAPDIVAGDILVDPDGSEYPILGVGPWPSDLAYFEVVADEVR